MNEAIPKLLRIMAESPQWKSTDQYQILIAAAEELERWQLDRTALENVVKGHNAMMRGIAEVKDPFIANVSGLFIKHLQKALLDARNVLPVPAQQKVCSPVTEPDWAKE